MNQFSIINLEKLDNIRQSAFFEKLASLIVDYLDDIQKEDLLNSKSLSFFVSNKGKVKESFEIVSELYHNITAGIQSGSGNQKLYNSLVAQIVAAWNIASI